MTDAELDARVKELRDDDLRDIAEDSYPRACPVRLTYYRPQLLMQEMAKEILRLRAENLRLRTCETCKLVGGEGCFGFRCDECWSELEAERDSLLNENSLL